MLIYNCYNPLGVNGYYVLVSYYRGKFFGLSNPALNHGEGRRAADQFLLSIDFQHFGVKVGGVAVAEFLDGVHTGFFQQVAVFFANALDAHQVCQVDPFEDQCVGDAGLLGKLRCGLSCQRLFSAVHRWSGRHIARSFLANFGPIPSIASIFIFFSPYVYSKFIIHDYIF